jgi:protein-S-isoprenylcysteine O-methyltransferase Ste14
MKKLILSTLQTCLIGVIAFSLLLFLPAWTFDYWQAWLFILVFLASTTAIGLYLSLKDPALLERRKKVGPAQETSTVQKIVMMIAIASLLGLLIFCAFDHRFAWSAVPPLGVLMGDVLIALSFVFQYRVFKENTFGGSTIETVDDQKVISTGPYAWVRHPMYVGVLIMVTGMPIALGSWWGLLVLVITLPGLVYRILDEENLLKKELPGYNEYMHKVRYRLVPYLW